MVQVLASAREVRFRGETGDILEVMDEVRLVEVTAVEREFAPLDGTSATDTAYGLLEAPNPAEQLRRESDLLAEDLDEPPLAETGADGHLRDGPRARRAPELPQGEGDGGVTRRGTGYSSEERSFEDAEPALRGPGFEQSLPEPDGIRAPQLVKRGVFVTQLGRGDAKKRESPRRLEVSAQRRRLTAPFIVAAPECGSRRFCRIFGE